MRWRLLPVPAIGVSLGVYYLLEATRYSKGTPAQPGPGLFPLLVGGLLVLGFAGEGLSSLLSSHQRPIDWPKGAARSRLLSLLGGIVGYVLLMPYLGHAIAAGLFLFVTLHLMGTASWLQKGLLAIAIAFISQYLFANVLGVPLPRGSLFG